ncbi:ABC transporter [candidate division KSB3 bacterium]|uniref:ABC transporter n=1 Tax=candidate division KSB3 bacterium TaxID=2044937 RepID=A0A2G6E415_9BACT|nr:MAG: ABC transporter [candidate division KSB3 bacterium]PIE29332.1 MAG: ABC transporter [candidate division KSB3 bacterium]
MNKKFSLNTQTAVLIMAFVMWILLSLGSKSFLSGPNIQNIMRQMAIQGVLGIAEVLVIVTAGIDLSVGSVVAFVNIIMSQMITGDAALSIPLAIIICFTFSALIGLAHGVLVFDFRLPPFIATLGTMTILRGVVLLLSGGSNVFGLPRSVADFASGDANFLGLPYLFWLLIITVFVIELVLRRTSFGRYIYALGSNPEAARLSGVNTRMVTYGVYMMASTLAGLAGVMETSRLWMGVPSTGTGYELDAIAAAVLGGTSLMGAEGTPAGAFVGALVMTTIYNGSVLLRVNPFWTRIIVGVILVVTVSVDQWRKRRAGE